MASTTQISMKVLARYGWRLFLVLVASIAAVWLVSELGLRMQGETAVRAPQEVELLIPEGTAAQVAAGQSPPTIPFELSFVEGDTLVVVNQDTQSHTLGPLYVPAKGSASMRLDTADHFALACSFNASKFLGLNVRQATTLRTRLLGISFAAPPTAMLLFVYSLIVFPVKQPKNSTPNGLAEPGG